jgi:hypothetical protein
MARYQYVILSRAKEGRLEEFEKWYDEVHLDDVLKVPGVVSARRFRVVQQQAEGLPLPDWCSVALYEMETDDPKKVLSIIHERAHTPVMPVSDALNAQGMVQIVGELVSQVGKT